MIGVVVDVANDANDLADNADVCLFRILLALAVEAKTMGTWCDWLRLVWFVRLEFCLLCLWRPRRWILGAMRALNWRLVLLASPFTGASRSIGWA